MIRVLIVEDSPTIRALFVDMLNGTGEIEVVGEALNGHQAVQMTANLAPDLITMDVFMPDMDGIEATRRIMAVTPTPILIVTGQVDSPDMNVIFEAMKAGALDVIEKPVLAQEAQYQAWATAFIEKVRTLSQLERNELGNSVSEEGKNHE